MSDDLVSKLRRMAERGTPNEAEIAREKLLAMGAGGRIPPRRPPSAGPDPSDIPDWFSQGMGDWRRAHATTTSSWTTSNTTANVRADFTVGGFNT